MSQLVADILSTLEDLAPSTTAEKWDNVGLLVGDRAWKTQGAVVSIDLTEHAIRKARDLGYGLIVTHHPCIFPKSCGISNITADSRGPQTGTLPALMLQAIQHRIAVISSHTNFDQCALEVVDDISRGLGFTPRGRLIEKAAGSLLKLIVFVPATHLDVVRSALSEAGAGHIGNYDSCSFSARGEGAFRGSVGTNPFLGKPGILEKVDEFRLETVFPRGLQKRILRALFAAHPYEEVAYDLSPVEQGPSKTGIVAGLGYGVWGDFPQPKTFSEVSRSVKSLFKLDGFWVTDLPPSRIRRVAFVAGKGASFIDAALNAECDLFVTGEAGYHAALDGFRRGVAVMELGHRESERFFLSTMRRWLSGQGLRVVLSRPPTQSIR